MRNLTMYITNNPTDYVLPAAFLTAVYRVSSHMSSGEVISTGGGAKEDD